MRPFHFAESDKRAGSSAVADRRRELLDHWQRTAKFVLPRRAVGQAVVSVAEAADALGCVLHFGSGTTAAGEVDACQVVPEDENTPPTGRKACYAWCEGAMSQAHAAVSLFHVRPGMPPS